MKWSVHWKHGFITCDCVVGQKNFGWLIISDYSPLQTWGRNFGGQLVWNNWKRFLKKHPKVQACGFDHDDGRQDENEVILLDLKIIMPSKELVYPKNGLWNSTMDSHEKLSSSKSTCGWNNKFFKIRLKNCFFGTGSEQEDDSLCVGKHALRTFPFDIETWTSLSFLLCKITFLLKLTTCME